MEGRRGLVYKPCMIRARSLVVQIVASMLRENKGLMELRLKVDRALAGIAAVRYTVSTILAAQYNHLGATGVEYLADALPHNYSLESLSLKVRSVLPLCFRTWCHRRRRHRYMHRGTTSSTRGARR